MALSGKIASMLKAPAGPSSSKPSPDDEMDAMYGASDDSESGSDPLAKTLAEASVEELQAALDKKMAEQEPEEEEEVSVEDDEVLA